MLIAWSFNVIWMLLHVERLRLLFVLAGLMVTSRGIALAISPPGQCTHGPGCGSGVQQGHYSTLPGSFVILPLVWHPIRSLTCTFREMLLAIQSLEIYRARQRNRGGYCKGNSSLLGNPARCSRCLKPRRSEIEGQGSPYQRYNHRIEKARMLTRLDKTADNDFCLGHACSVSI